jgi:hypothetical protein
VQWIDGRRVNSDTYIPNGKTTRERLAGRAKSKVCDICNEEANEICFDHNHITGAFRGWLCHRCNLILGKLQDNPELSDKITKYLRKNQ